MSLEPRAGVREPARRPDVSNDAARAARVTVVVAGD
jgi:hypothetical protein